jgi:heterodisulfide reductase subunit B
MVEVLIEDLGYNELKKPVVKPLAGIKIAGYIGCQNTGIKIAGYIGCPNTRGQVLFLAFSRDGRGPAIN